MSVRVNSFSQERRMMVRAPSTRMRVVRWPGSRNWATSLRCLSHRARRRKARFTLGWSPWHFWGGGTEGGN